MVSPASCENNRNLTPRALALPVKALPCDLENPVTAAFVVKLPLKTGSGAKIDCQ